MRTTVSQTLLLTICLMASVARAQQPPPPPLQTAPMTAPTAPAYPPTPEQGYPPPPAGYAYPPPGYAYPPPQYLQVGPPPPVRYELKPSYALIFSGIGVLGFGYTLDIFGTLVANHNPAWECALPVIGPWMQVNDSFSTDWKDLARAFFVTDALIQTVGLALTIAGASVWRKVPVRVAQNGFAVTF